MTGKAIPLAYFITFTCYGTWLHGEKSISVDRYRNIYATDYISLEPERAFLAKRNMIEQPYILDELKRTIVLNAINSVCEYHQWQLFAAHVRTNHVHLVVHSLLSAERVMNTIKAYVSRHLNRVNLDGNRIKRWTRHGSTRYLWKEEEIESTIQYVVHEQGEPMAVFENKSRLMNTLL